MPGTTELLSFQCLKNILKETFEQRDGTPRKTHIHYTCTKHLCYSPCVVQVPDHPRHRLRCPLDLVRAGVYCHLKAGYRLNRQTLRHHRHCRHPKEEEMPKGWKCETWFLVRFCNCWWQSSISVSLSVESSEWRTGAESSQVDDWKLSYALKLLPAHLLSDNTSINLYVTKS